ncbi:MAG: peptidylprolyl isomerase, partial [Acidimicrobiales bacterium]|nr:peptidylprolyl isomerase [Acidimicrobiales bacterium]
MAAQVEMARQAVLVRALFESEVKANPITDLDLQKQYEDFKKSMGENEYKIRHILVDKEDDAKAIIAELGKGGDFAKIAKEKSKDPGSKDNGGDLDWGPSARYVKPFADAVVGNSSWQPARFEYTASLGARRSADAFGETTLTAARYDGDTLDWYEFDVNGEVNLGTTAAEAGEVLTRTLMPAAVTAPGLPARRFWEFEDGRLNLASLKPAETDLAQILLIETLSGYGNDWFVIGVELPVGRLVSGRSLVVTDTFGTRTLLRPHGDPATGGSGRWGLFQHAMPFDAEEPEGAAITNLLYLAPRLAQPVLGPVVEQVVLARDEQANLGWAVEQLRESPLQVGVELSAARPPDAPGD